MNIYCDKLGIMNLRKVIITIIKTHSVLVISIVSINKPREDFNEARKMNI